ncbi:MAG: hypothetical protein K9N51_03050 [Candidatus Pacebacteria bacterium]|nr:hypothetical protein [Candidatus Paceibacterota bacterium]
MRRIAILLIITCCLPPHFVSADDTTTWDFFERHPQLQGWFPFGIYAGGGTRLYAPGTTQKERSEWLIELQALQGCNVIWGQHPTTRNIARNADDEPVGWNAFGEWFYGINLPEHEIRIWPSLSHWLRYRNPVWGDLTRNEPLPSTAELAKSAEVLAPVLDFARRMYHEYPHTIVGYITDDEPHAVASAVAAQRLVETVAGAPAMTCKPSWGGFQSFAAHMQPMTGDFYVTQDGGNHSWKIAEYMTWLRENLPQRVFYFLPLASAYQAHEQTLPDLKDSRPTAADMRMQFWMSFAGGCKGYFYYHLLYDPFWMRGEDNLLNLVLEPNGDLWGEVGRLSKVATTIGPFLLPCRPLNSDGIAVDCGDVHFIEYRGPALGVGLLQDIVHPTRHFIVPWNNDVRGPQKGVLHLPDDLLDERQVYDMLTLNKVAVPNGTLSVSLAPGSGHVFMVGTAEDFAVCADIVRKARVRHPRVVSRIRRKLLARQPGADTTAVDTLIEQAKAAETARDWTAAEAAYRNAIAAVDDAEKNMPRLIATRRTLDQLAATLSDTDDLLRTHWRVLDLDKGSRSLHTNHYRNPRVGDEIRRFMVLVGQYLSSRIAERNGERIYEHLLLDRATILVEQAQANRKAVQEALDKALTEKRRPIRVAVFTPDRHEVEYNLNFAWIYKHALARWFVPDAQGIRRDRQGKAWDPSDWDVTWAQQLLFSTGKARLSPALSSHAGDLAEFVRNGGGLVLTGVAGLLAQELEIETVTPDRVRESSTYKQGLSIGLSPAPGMAEHPALASLDGDFAYTNASFPGHDFFAEVAWEDSRPSGRVVAIEYDQLFGPIGTYAAMVEYSLGKGKVMLCGGRAVDLTPGNPFGIPGVRRPAELQANLRRVLLDTFTYAADDQTYLPDAADIAAAIPSERPFVLPIENWKFRLDPERVGVDQGWMRPDIHDDKWDSIRIGANWESQGYDYNGVAWYRQRVKLHNRPGQRTMLHFGAVDEQATVFIDGKRVGHNQGEPEGWEAWDQPFAMDITPFLTDDDREHLLVIRVLDHSSAGGIWKPVFVRYEKMTRDK